MAPSGCLEIIEAKAGDKIYAFDTAEGRGKKITSPYWTTEKDFLAMKKKYHDTATGRWDSHLIKEELSLPCYNRANTVLTAEVTDDHDMVHAKTGDATENLAYIQGKGKPRFIVKKMQGGGYQTTPDSKKLKPLRPTTLVSDGKGGQVTALLG